MATLLLPTEPRNHRDTPLIYPSILSNQNTPKSIILNMATAYYSKTSLEAIPILKGKENYSTWVKQMDRHLKASKAWEIILGKWRKPREPSYFEAPVRPQDTIHDHKPRCQIREEAHEDD